MVIGIGIAGLLANLVAAQQEAQKRQGAQNFLSSQLSGIQPPDPSVPDFQGANPIDLANKQYAQKIQQFYGEPGFFDPANARSGSQLAAEWLLKANDPTKRRAQELAQKQFRLGQRKQGFAEERFAKEFPLRQEETRLKGLQALTGQRGIALKEKEYNDAAKAADAMMGVPNPALLKHATPQQKNFWHSQTLSPSQRANFARFGLGERPHKTELHTLQDGSVRAFNPNTNQVETIVSAKEIRAQRVLAEGAVARAKGYQGKMGQDLAAAEAKAVAELPAFAGSVDDVRFNLNRIRNTLGEQGENAGYTGLSAYLNPNAWIPGTPQMNYFRNLDSMRSQLFLVGKRIAGSMGQLSDRDVDELKSVFGSFSPDLSAPAMLENLNRLDVVLDRMLDNKTRAARGDFTVRPGEKLSDPKNYGGLMRAINQLDPKKNPSATVMLRKMKEQGIERPNWLSKNRILRGLGLSAQERELIPDPIAETPTVPGLQPAPIAQPEEPKGLLEQAKDVGLSLIGRRQRRAAREKDIQRNIRESEARITPSRAPQARGRTGTPRRIRWDPRKRIFVED